MASTEAAGTISQIARGVSSCLTSSATEVVPEDIALSFKAPCTVLSWRAMPTTVWPLRSSLLAIFAPMRPSPINPSCISLFLSVYYTDNIMHDQQGQGQAP